jgi:hypothetical protein
VYSIAICIELIVTSIEWDTFYKAPGEPGGSKADNQEIQASIIQSSWCASVSVGDSAANQNAISLSNGTGSLALMGGQLTVHIQLRASLHSFLIIRQAPISLVKKDAINNPC